MSALTIRPLTKLLATVALFSAISAFAVSEGTKDGGGGGAYVCRNADGSIRKSMMADLWEAQKTPFRWPNHKGFLQISKSDESAELQFQRALKKLESVDPRFAVLVNSEMKKIWAESLAMPDDTSIAVPDDLKLGYFPTDCPPEGMMFYNDEVDRLHIRSDLFSKLEKQTDVAAAWMHEAVYKIMREKAGHRTSKFARRLVGCLFSEGLNCLVAKPVEVPTDRVAFQCKSDSYEVTIFPQEPITDPKKFLDGTHYLRVLMSKSGKLRFGYSPELGIKFRKNNYNEVVAYFDSIWSKDGFSAFEVPPIIFFDPTVIFSRESGDIQSVTVKSLRRFFIKRPIGDMTPQPQEPDLENAEETLACTRIR